MLNVFDGFLATIYDGLQFLCADGAEDWAQDFNISAFLGEKDTIWTDRDACTAF